MDYQCILITIDNTLVFCRLSETLLRKVDKVTRGNGLPPESCVQVITDDGKKFNVLHILYAEESSMSG